jgi:hypothetical protein
MTTNLDIALHVAATVALQIPDAKEIGGKKLAGWRVSFGCTGKEAETALAIFTAIKTKHLVRKDGKRQDWRENARALVLDILAQKKDWKPHAGIIAAFAEKNDRDFFERLGRSIYRDCKPIFDPLDWLLIMNWHGWHADSWRNWNNPDRATILKHPPLKFWTAAALGELLQTVLRCTTIGAKALEKRRLALGLALATPA